ncbi:MAG: hypothetical protein H0W44_07020 [Gammaproteobacteria bacterium]|nr:hypothetical protein [Gammaproteobacteria bacterium]
MRDSVIVIEQVDDLEFDDVILQDVAEKSFSVPENIKKSKNLNQSPVFTLEGILDMRFRLLREARERVKQLMLETVAWNILWQINGKRSVADISETLSLNADLVVYHIESLRLMGVICPVGAVSLPNFIKEKTGKNFNNQARRSVDANVEASINVSGEHVEKNVNVDQQADRTGNSNFNIVAQAIEKTLDITTNKIAQFQLRELINLVHSRKGGGQDAKMAIYLMMASVDRDLLLNDGVSSFKYFDEDIYLKNPILIRQLLDYASKSIGYDIRHDLRQDLTPFGLARDAGLH